MEEFREKVTNVIENLTRKDQRHIDVHRNTVDNGINQIKLRVETIRTGAIQLSIMEGKDWEKGEVIVQDTTVCLELLLEILKRTQDAPVIRFRQCKEVFPLIFAIIKDTSVIVCHICQQITHRFSTEHHKEIDSIVQIPEIVDEILSFLTPDIPTDLSNEAKIDNVSSSDIQECRVSLHASCIEFCSFICKEMKPVLKSMKINNIRTSEKFKPFLICEVRQCLFIQRVCGLARELLKCTPADERNTEMERYKQMFKQTRRILIHGRSIIRSLSASDAFSLNFKAEISPVCQDIKECKTQMIRYRKSGEGSLDTILKSIETACYNIGECIKLGKKCLPPGEELVEEDISILTSSDFEEVADSDFEEEKDSDFVGTLKKLSPDKYQEDVKDSDFEKNEIIQVYKMEDFSATTRVCLDNKGEFSWQTVKGKVKDSKSGKWTQAQDIKIDHERNKVTMTIEPGDIFVVHYEFPSGKKEFSKNELSKGVSMEIPEASCCFKIPPTEHSDSLTVKYKVHITDKERIRGYQEEKPEEYGHITISEGIQVTSQSPINNGMIELPNEEQNEEKAKYVRITSDSGSSNWTPEIVEPRAHKKSLAFELKPNSTTHVVKITESQISSRDDQRQKGFLEQALDDFLTLLGLKAKCKLLTMFRIPEDDPDLIELRAECIESQRFYLNKKSNAMLDKGWLQIQDGDESADFTIKSGGKVKLLFSENMKTSVKLNSTPQIEFLKKSTSFVNVEVSDPGVPTGHLEYYVGNICVDWKRLTWSFLRQRYEAACEIEEKEKHTNDERKNLQRQRQREREKMELNAIRHTERVVNDIYLQLTEDEKQRLRKEMHMDTQKTEESFLERMVVRIKDQSNPFKYINNLLMKLGRLDLHETLMENAVL
ncbi:uncharacterized protein LOC134230598 [Saccostrea cucullata]|uniref:uncharacterized protein LOC134230598 n=1 Tax=Saccostrea cuccullata TaxID=36930 RepID=UPI002ECFF5D7